LPLGGQLDNYIKQESDFLLFCLNNTVFAPKKTTKTKNKKQQKQKKTKAKVLNSVMNTFKNTIKKGWFTILRQLS
jgi:hypothetical protein